MYMRWRNRYDNRVIVNCPKKLYEVDKMLFSFHDKSKLWDKQMDSIFRRKKYGSF